MRSLFVQRCRDLRVNSAALPVTAIAPKQEATVISPAKRLRQSHSDAQQPSQRKQPKGRFPDDLEYPSPRVMQYHPPPKRKAELPMLDLSPLLWDLVDENSPGVRTYDENDHKEQVLLWKNDNTMSDLVRRMRKFKHEMVATENEWFMQDRNPFDPRQTSELDVLSTALLGVTPAPPSGGEADTSDNTSSSTGDPRRLGAPLFRSIGVADRISEDSSLTVQLLIHRLQAYRSFLGSLGKEYRDVTDQLREEIAGSDFRRIKRILAPLIRDDKGRAIVMGCLPDILSAISKDGKPSPEASRYLRDLWYNLERNFCRRFGHQTAVIDRKLYVDGGFVNYNPPSQVNNNYNYSSTEDTGLLYHDLDTIAPAGMPQLYANLTKNSSVPSVHGGTLWADDVNKRLYLFGGEYYLQPPPRSFNLWSYDVMNNEWVSFGPPGQAAIDSVSYGAGASVSELGQGFFFGGWISNNTDPDWSGVPVATTGMVKYDMDSNSWSNITGPDSIRRAEGVMVFLPIGDGGMLVYFGGIQDLYANGTVAGQPMEQILLYDVLSSKWYKQNATGDVPEMRARFCAGASWAPDQSSYNIYLYGGAGMPPSTAGFDDVYILTIPTFQWIKLYPDGPATGDYPHHSLTCNVISNSQMMIIGGSFPLTSQCDAPDQFGSHNLDLGLQNPDHAPWKLFIPNLTTPAVAPPIVSLIGGSPQGSATKTAPSRGFDHPDLKVLMARKAFISVRTPTRTPTSTAVPSKAPLSTGAIAGISVAGFVVLVSLLLGCVCLIRRRRRRIAAARETPPAGATPWSPHSTHTNTASYTPSSPLPGSPFMQQPHRTFSPVELEAPPGSRLWHSPDGTMYELVSSGREGGGGGTGEVETKVDSEGRVWVRMPTLMVGSTSPTVGAGGGYLGGHSPVTPSSSLGTGTVEVPPPLPPQELAGSERERGEMSEGEWPRQQHQTYYHA
ncbi:hypothetical protein OQA88_475 [Cercophora sp. LCS_1]